MKTAIDKIAAGTLLLALSPVMLGAALAIKLDSRGPVLFKQPRHGKNNETFLIWKFRTMTVMETGHDIRQATKNDNRVTRVGRFLRRTSLDELPQLVNVLLGDMSLVGPRPHPACLNEQFAPFIGDYWTRHVVKPGITGLAQVRGFRGPTDGSYKMRQRVESDLEYIEEWSIWLDLKILLATPFSILIGKNAF